MSKWFSNESLEKFVDDKINEDAKKESGRYQKWATPVGADVDKNNIYTIRLLPDKSKNFYKKMHYHMIEDTSGKWHFILCTKTFDFDNYCPVCAAVYKLYKGSDYDKKLAGKLKRKEKFVQNILVKEDPRDSNQTDENLRVNGKVMLYEFPGKLEAKIKNQLIDKKNGLGGAIFDPSEEGFDLIIKVKLTKPGPDGKKWPSYDDTEFARRPSSAADSEEAIDALIESTVDLNEYLNSMVKPVDQVIEVLKDLQVFDYIEDEATKKLGLVKEEKEELPQEENKQEENQDDSSSGDNGDSSDEDFLKELENL